MELKINNLSGIHRRRLGLYVMEPWTIIIWLIVIECYNWINENYISLTRIIY